MGDFTIEKDRLSVVIHSSDGSRTKGELFLLPFNNFYDGHQNISDLLESDPSFIPLSVNSGKDVEFMNKSQILLVEGELFEETDAELAVPGLVHQIEVSIVIVDTYIIKGVMLSDVPPEYSRISDCLNLDEQFLRIKSDDSYLHVNKNFIKKVIGGYIDFEKKKGL